MKPSLVICACLFASMLAGQGHAQTIYENNFDQYQTEFVYTDDDLDGDWNTPVFNDGVTEGRVSIVGANEAFGGSGSAMSISYPSGEDGTKETGAQWQYDFDADYEEVYFRYRVKFRSGFDFVRGGKLPGLAGGTSPTGSTTADGTNGFTARMMWRTDFDGVSGSPEQTIAEGISYAKYTDSGYDESGQDEDQEYWFDADGTRTLMQSGVWYEIIQRVKMNDAGVRNGVLQIWLDGNLVLDQQDVLWRTDNSFAIDQIYFSTFFGGNEDWRTSKDEVAFFDDFLISTALIESTVDSDDGGTDDGGTDDGGTDDGGTDDGGTDDGGTDDGGTDDGGTDDGGTDDGGTDDGGTDDGGTDKEPRFIKVPEHFDSIQAAIDDACPGDTVAVRGEWVANIVVDKAILFRGYEDTRITAANDNLPVISVVADGAHVWKFELRNGVNGLRTDAGLSDVKIERIVSVYSKTSGIRVRENCHGVYLKKCKVYYSSSHGIYVDRSDDFQVVDCKAFHADATGIQINGGTNGLVDDCTAWGNVRGFSICGESHTLNDNFAYLNELTAFGIEGDYHTIHDNVSKYNGRGFSFALSSGNRLTENVSREDEMHAFQFRLLSNDNVAIDNIAKLPGGISLYIDRSTGNYFDDFRGLEGRGGVLMNSNTADNELHNSLIQDNERFGVINRGAGNTFHDVIKRRNPN